MIAFKEFIGALKITLFEDHDIIDFIELLCLGILYTIRLIRYEYLFPFKCEKCRGETKVYFRRSIHSIFGDGSEYELYDWLICQTCRVCRPL